MSKIKQPTKQLLAQIKNHAMGTPSAQRCTTCGDIDYVDNHDLYNCVDVLSKKVRTLEVHLQNRDICIELLCQELRKQTCESMSEQYFFKGARNG